MADVLFWVLAILLAASAAGVVLSRNLYHAAYCLAAALVVTAVFYLALTAPLLAAVQLLLYTGGVLTLVVFALALTAQTDDPGRWRRPVPASILALLVFLVVAGLLGNVESPVAAGGLEDGQAAGRELFARYVVPFELLSVLLLGAIFGALAIARREGTS
jgi:NADH:ubiquinone oxidoreductase subunit 6 (subunit J)